MNMKKLKSVIRVLKLVILIALATIGLGIVGGVPIQVTFKKEVQEPPIEWVIPENEDTDLNEIDIKQLS